MVVSAVQNLGTKQAVYVQPSAVSGTDCILCSNNRLVMTRTGYRKADSIPAGYSSWTKIIDTTTRGALGTFYNPGRKCIKLILRVPEVQESM